MKVISSAITASAGSSGDASDGAQAEIRILHVTSRINRLIIVRLNIVSSSLLYDEIGAIWCKFQSSI
jgi:hypothetical protein